MNTGAITEYAILFGWSFLAATVLPIGSEVAFAAIVHREGTWLLPLVVATIGNSLGSLTTYWLGRRASQLLEHRPAPSPRALRAARALSRHGQPLLFFAWVPVAGDALVGAAGAARLPLAACIPWVVAGKCLRYAVLAWSVLKI